MELERAKEIMRLQLDNGTTCPCCAQFVKMYKRPLSAHMVVSLMGLYKCSKLAKKTWFHINEFVPKGQTGAGDYAFMRFWLLIQMGKSKKGSGLWRITANGREFVEGRLQVQSHAKIYDGKLFGLCGNYKDIHQCLGKKFSYEELMQ